MAELFKSELQVSLVDDGAIAVVRVVGRGSFQNCISLKRFAEQVQSDGGRHRFLVDLSQCETMDSTFMGVLASIAIGQTAAGAGKLVVLNCNAQTMRLLKTLGLVTMMDVRSGTAPELNRAEASLKATATPEVTRLEQLCMTLQAHRELIALDEKNEVRFQSVVKYLEDSLAREAARSGAPIK